MSTTTMLDEKTVPRIQISPEPDSPPPSNVEPLSPTPSEKALDDVLPPPYSENSPTHPTSSPSYADADHLPAFSASSSRSSPVRLLFIDMKGNRFRPWPIANNHSLETPIWDSTRSEVLYKSTRFKKNSGTCVLKGAVDRYPNLEIGTKYSFGPGNDPVIRFNIRDTSGADKEVEFEVKGKGCSRTRYFVLPEEIGGGGYFEWGYAKIPNKGEPQDSAQNRPSSPIPPEVEKAFGRSEKRKSKEAKRPEEFQLSLKDHLSRGPSRMMLFKYPSNPLEKDHSKSSHLNGEYSEKLAQEVPASSMKPIKVAEFVRADDDGNEIVSLAWGPAGQGGWLKIWEDNVVPDWLVIATCLVMLKRERDRRALQMTMIVSGGASGGGS